MDLDCAGFAILLFRLFFAIFAAENRGTTKLTKPHEIEEAD